MRKEARTDKNKSRVQKTALFGMLTALAFLFGYIESLMAFQFAVPGIKLGLANVVVLSALYVMGPRPAFGLTVVRVVLSGFLAPAGLYHILYGLFGALFSYAVMVLLYRTKKFSIIGVSIAGGAGHNIGQLAAAMLVLSKSMAYYLPFLLIGGLASGILVGILGRLLIFRLQKIIQTHKLRI